MPQALSKRSSERYPFVASCVATETRSSVGISARTSDLGRGGCYIDTTAHFPVGTDLVLGVKRDGKTLVGASWSSGFVAHISCARSVLSVGIVTLSTMYDREQVPDRGCASMSRGAIHSSVYRGFPLPTKRKCEKPCFRSDSIPRLRWSE
jgi:hypothetical protein